jgi:hypothetical protein
MLLIRRPWQHLSEAARARIGANLVVFASLPLPKKKGIDSIRGIAGMPIQALGVRWQVCSSCMRC